MDKELQKKLFDDFYWLFIAFRDGSKSFILRAKNGWYPLIYEMCQEIESTFETVGQKEETHFLTLENHHGYLNVGISSNFGVSAKVLPLIDKYSDKSKIICESCGKPKKWIPSRNKSCSICEDCRENVKA